MKVTIMKQFTSILFSWLLLVFAAQANAEFDEESHLNKLAMETKTAIQKMDKEFILKYVAEEGMKNKKDFEYWIDLCLEYNKVAKASKKKK